MTISIIGGTTVCNECGERLHGMKHECTPAPPQAREEGEIERELRWRCKGRLLSQGWTANDRELDQLAADHIARLEKKVAGYAKHLDLCEQEAGKALGYPWYKDDQKNFPGATEENGVCIGEHVGDTIVAELANAYRRLEKDRAGLVKALFEGASWFDEYADSHEKKGAMDKALRNAKRANALRTAALAGGQLQEDISNG